MRRLEYREQKFSEEILLALNEHWIIILKPLLALLIGVAIFVVILLTALGLKAENFIAAEAIIITDYIALLLLIHWVFISLFEWSISSWYIGEKHLVIFNTLPYIKNDVTFIKIAEIDEIEEEQHGLLANIFNYGKVKLNLPASPKPVFLYFVPQPSKVVNILEAIRENRFYKEIEIDVLRRLYRRRIKFSVKDKS